MDKNVNGGVETVLKLTNSKFFMITLILITLTAVFAFSINDVSAAPNIYINATSGNDANNGLSWATAKRTISNGLTNTDNNGNLNIANGTYTGSSNRGITINKNVNITGVSTNGVIIDLANQNRAFTIRSGYTVNISNLTIQNGRVTNDNKDGGAFYNQGSLTVTNCRFVNNNADRSGWFDSSNGGAIYSVGNLKVDGCTFTGNNADDAGGAIVSMNTFSVERSTFTSNTAGNNGGAIAFGLNSNNPGSGTMTLDGNYFTLNNADQNGGAIWLYGTSTIKNNNFFDNNADDNGGAIRSWATSTITSNNFQNNTAADGDAISVYRGTATAQFNRFLSNGTNDVNVETIQGTFSGNYNWWGINTGPGTGRVTGPNSSITNWLKLTLTVNPTNIHVGETSAVTADLNHDKNDNPVMGGYVPNAIPGIFTGIPVNFTSTYGTVNPVSAIFYNGSATTTYTCTAPATSSVSAKVDNQTVSKPIQNDPKAVLVLNQTVNGQNTGKLVLNTGDTVTFLITAMNNGPSTATAINISDLIPAGLIGVTVTPSVGTYDPVTGIWNIPSLVNGAIATLNITGRIGSSLTGTTFTNTATQTSQAEYNPNPYPSSTSIPVQVFNTSVNLYVTNYPWQSGVYTYNYKQQIVMLAQLNNLGETTATNIVVNYVIGSAFKVVSYNLIQPGILSFNSTTNTFTWTIPNLAGGNNTYTGSYASFSVLLESLQTGSGGSAFQTTSTIISSDQTNTGTTTTRTRNLIINPSADIQTTQTVNNPNPQTGDYITITIKAKNNGPNNATNINLTNLLPNGLYLDPVIDPNTSYTTTQGTYNHTTGEWTIGNLNNSAEATLTIIAKVTAATGTQINNYAYRSGTPEQYDWNTANDTQEINILVQ